MPCASYQTSNRPSASPRTSNGGVAGTGCVEITELDESLPRASSFDPAALLPRVQAASVRELISPAKRDIRREVRRTDLHGGLSAALRQLPLKTTEISELRARGRAWLARTWETPAAPR